MIVVIRLDDIQLKFSFFSPLSPTTARSVFSAMTCMLIPIIFKVILGTLDSVLV